MTIADLLAPEHILLDVRAADKRRLLDDLARRAAAAAGVESAAVAEALHAREQLGSTGMGSGIAIPHARLAGSNRPLGLFARLRTPIDFDAIDGQRVDLVFLLLLPSQAQGDHLNALASVARRLRAETVTAALRKAPDAKAVYAVLTDQAAS
jgi:nitrogen PTS system EIIA component